MLQDEIEDIVLKKPKNKDELLKVKGFGQIEVAINQIKAKEYVEKLRKENECKQILAVAICYDSKKKEHNCKIEEI